eukprot:Opistho-1_new@108694
MEAKKAEKTQQALHELLLLDDNKFCADCPTRGPRWASWNLGIFLCMRCAGLHRNLGAHITKIKSITLDKWTPEQVEFMKSMGNRRSNESYMALVDRSFQQPADQDEFIRRKYQRKEWYAPPEVAATVRREAAPAGSPAGMYSHQIAQLNGMGFTNHAMNMDALTKAKGDVNVAIEDLIARTGGESAPQEAPPVDRAVQLNLDQLVAMGFTDMNLNRAALQRCNNNLNAALEDIIARSDELRPVPPPIAPPPSSDPWGISAAPPAYVGSSHATPNRGTPNRGTPTPTHPQQQPAAAAMPDLLGDLATPVAASQPAAPSAMPLAPTTTAPPKSKQDILSLYDAPLPSNPPTAYAVNPFGQATMVAGAMPTAIGVVPIYGAAAAIPYAYGTQPSVYAVPAATGSNPFLAPNAPGPNPFNSPSLQRSQWGQQQTQQSQSTQQQQQGSTSDPFAGLSRTTGTTSTGTSAAAPSW